MSSLNLIFLGPPGAGKGTQAKVLSSELDLIHISTGDLLRESVNNNSALGIKAKVYMQKGELVPDEIVTNLVVDKLKNENNEKGIILDGFPRTKAQAKSLDLSLEEFNQKIDCVLYFKTSESTIIERLSGRRVCRGCGVNYHLKNIPPKVDNICDICGEELYQRDDDSVSTITKRIQVYEEQTASLIGYYKIKGVLREISGDFDADKVKRILLSLFKKEHLL
jgi:adenylate kinase